MALRNYRYIPAVFSTANPFPILLVAASVYTAVLFDAVFAGQNPLIHQLERPETMIMVYLLLQGAAFAFVGAVHSVLGLTIDYIQLIGLDSHTQLSDDDSPEPPQPSASASEVSQTQAQPPSPTDSNSGETDDQGVKPESVDDGGENKPSGGETADSAYQLVSDAVESLETVETASSDEDTTDDESATSDQSTQGASIPERTVTIPPGTTPTKRAYATPTPLTELAVIYFSAFMMLCFFTLYVARQAILPSLFFTCLIICTALIVAGWRTEVFSPARWLFGGSFRYADFRAATTPLSYQLWRGYLVAAIPLVPFGVYVADAGLSPWWTALVITGSLVPTATFVVMATAEWGRASRYIAGSLALIGLFTFGLTSGLLALPAYLRAPQSYPSRFTQTRDDSGDEATIGDEDSPKSGVVAQLTRERDPEETDTSSSSTSEPTSDSSSATTSPTTDQDQSDSSDSLASPQSDGENQPTDEPTPSESQPKGVDEKEASTSPEDDSPPDESEYGFEWVGAPSEPIDDEADHS